MQKCFSLKEEKIIIPSDSPPLRLWRSPFCTLALSPLFYPPSTKRRRKKRECVHGARTSEQSPSSKLPSRLCRSNRYYTPICETIFFPLPFSAFFSHSQRNASVLGQHVWLTIGLRANDAMRNLHCRYYASHFVSSALRES